MIVPQILLQTLRDRQQVDAVVCYVIADHRSTNTTTDTVYSGKFQSKHEQRYGIVTENKVTENKVILQQGADLNETVPTVRG